MSDANLRNSSFDYSTTIGTTSKEEKNIDKLKEERKNIIGGNRQSWKFHNERQEDRMIKIETNNIMEKTERDRN